MNRVTFIELLAVLFALLGLTAVVYGCYLISPIAAWIVGGLILLYLSKVFIDS